MLKTYIPINLPSLVLILESWETIFPGFVPGT
jgi:hypothetical protein